MFKSMFKSEKGFTLIELIVVIVIIALLSAIILAGLNVIRIRGRNAARQKDMNAVKIALEQYFDAHGSYPVNNPYSAPAPKNGFVTSMITLKSDGLLSQVPLDPRDPQRGSPTSSNWNQDSTYYYGYGSDGNAYILGYQEEATAGFPGGWKDVK